MNRLPFAFFGRAPGRADRRRECTSEASPSLLTGSVFLLASLALSGVAAAQSTYGEEAKTRLELAQRVAPLTEDGAFGEQIGQFNGSLSFRYVDVSLPGTDQLKVEFARVANNEYSPNFWGWDIDIPKITTVMPRTWTGGWTAEPPNVVENDRNVEFRRTDYWTGFRMRVDGQTSTLLYRALQPDQLPSDSRVPLGPSPASQWRFMTKAGWLFRTIPAQGRPGSSLVGRSPDGLVYTFDHFVKDQYDFVQHPTKMKISTATGPGYSVSTADPEVLGRDIYVLYVSKIEDRFGNVVNFDWTGPKLNRIRANDGRLVEITSQKVIPFVSDEEDPRYEVTAVSANGRTWAYSQTNQSGPASVTNPDGSHWTYEGVFWKGFNLIEFDRTRYETHPGLGTHMLVPNLIDIAYCTKAYPLKSNQDRTIAVTTPSGARAEYLLRPVRHGRANTPLSCHQMGDSPNTWTSRIPRYVDEWTLQRKTVSGPGIAAVVSNYSYAGTDVTFDAAAAPYVGPGEIWNPALHSHKTVTVARSDGEVRKYVFGRTYGEDEGLLLAEEILREVDSGDEEKSKSTSTQLYRRTEYSYVPPSENPSQAFALSWGSSHVGFGDNFTNLHVPMRKTTVLQDGVQFSSEVLAFDRYVAPTQVRKQSANAPGSTGYAGYTKTETYQNYDNETSWVLRQPGTMGVDGTEVSRVVYHPTSALPQYVYSFNQAQPAQTIAYNAAGHVQSVTDARGKVTTLSNWKRGIPRSITFHDNSGVSAEVDDNGWVGKVVDQAGHSTCYGYDSAGRVNLIRRSGDGICSPVDPFHPAWAPTTISFEKSASPAWGLPAGHWVRTESRGTGITKGAQIYNSVTRYDALWRPVMQHEWDEANPAATRRYLAWSYDTAGRQVFVADPRDSASGIASFAGVGMHTVFDPLGRPVRSYRPSELGVNLETLYVYQPGFRTNVRNPRGFSTTTHYQAYDGPDTSMPVRIEAPLGVTTVIARDVFGKPKSISRSGVHQGQPLNVVRNYVYDAQQRLCKRTEPETGTTILDYDAAGNLVWSAAGLALPGLACDRGQVGESQKVRRTYDDLNRLAHLTFPDGLGNQQWAYTADGLAETVTTQNAGGASIVNSYVYNNRRLLTSETLSQSDGVFWSLGYTYDSLGHLSSQAYPSGLSIGYLPNALGQATRAGTYATAAHYYPNGALKGFTYGNGLVHQMTQNARGLPERSRAAGLGVTALDDSYDYDENGNVAGISDALPGNRGNRMMGYDALDRLTSTASPMFGVAAYTYDPLDNLRRVAVSQGPRSRDHTYVYNAQQRLSSVTHTATSAHVLALAYDAQGNLSSRDGQGFTFDLGNRLREVPGVEQYRYDAHGRRIRAVSPTQGAIHSLYGNDGVLRFQRDERAGKTTDFVYLAGSLVAQVSNPISAGPAAPSISAPATSTGSYTVSWSSSSGATVYRLEERVGTAGFSEILVGAGTSHSFGGRPSGTYAYRVRACTTSPVSSCGAYSAIAQVVVTGVPPAPVLSAPATSTNGNYTVSWTSSTGATLYRLEEQISGVWSEFQPINQTAQAFTSKPAGTYGYRVRACATSLVTSCSAPSNIVTVAVGLPSPTLSAPSTSTNGSYLVSWTPISGATRYRLEEQANAGAWNEIQSSNALDRSVSGKAEGLYGYRVRACATEALTSCSAYSNIASVSVSLLPPAPTLSAPASSNDGSYTVSWTTTNGASYYRLDERQGGGAWQQIQGSSTTTRGFSGKTNGSYEYRVRACRSSQESECGVFSATRTVVVDLIALPPAPVLSAPASNTTGAYTVSWTSVTNGNFYRLEERANSGSWGELQNLASTSRNVSGKGSGTYEYRVRACRSTHVAECGSFSNAATVTVSIPSVPPVPSISGPASSSPDHSFVIAWTTSAGATSYELQQSRSGMAWQNIYAGAELSQLLQRGLGGVYSYRVRACASAGCSAYSQEHQVYVEGGPFQPQPPSLTAPASSTTGFYTVSWGASSGASAYRLEEQANGGSWGEIYNGPNSSLALSSRPSGSFAYRIRACSNSGLASCGYYSDERTVQVNLVQVPLPPTGLSVPSTSTGSYTVTWSASSGATQYRLEEMANGGGWAEIYSGTALSRGFSSKPAGTYSYRVRACASANVAECSGYAGPVTVVVSNGAVIPDAPALTAPTSSGSGNYSLNWSSPAGANRYRLEESANGGAWTEVQNLTASTASISGKPNGSYSYRVRACSSTEVSHCGGYSNVGTVSVSIAQVPANPPVLTGPANTSTDFQFTLGWNAVTHATRYELEQSRNGGAWTNVYTGSELSWTVQRGPATFAYRIRACSDAGCSAYSATHTVVVLPSNN